MDIVGFFRRYGETITDTAGWYFDETGVYRETFKGHDTQRVYATHQGIMPTRVYENLDTGKFKVELQYILGNGNERKITVDKGTICNKNSIVKLADSGIDVTSGTAQELMRFLTDIIACNPGIKTVESKSVMGWIGNTDKFVPYCTDIAYDEDESYKHLYKALRKHGDHDEYVEFVRELRKNRQLRLVMAASFASPLIAKIGENPFVLMIHGGTGIAKSVALMVAMSVWGDPAFGRMTRTMDMTANSMMATAAFLNNLPFAGDELQTIKSRWGNYDNLIMKVTEGVDRGRMTYSTINETKSWKCAFLFTGEEPCTKSDSGGGVKNRVIEVECTKPLVENGNLTANFVKENYGLVAEEYICALKDYDLKAMYSKQFQAILKTEQTTDKQAGAMALLLIADEIARKSVFHDADPMLLADVSCYLRDANEVDVTQRAYDWLINYICENGAYFRNESNKVWGQFTDDDNCVWFNASVLGKELTAAGFDLDACRKVWESKGYLRKENGAYKVRKRIYGSPAWCYKIVLNKAGDDDDY